jgi:DNA-binding NarL/FixJ family response regulator
MHFGHWPYACFYELGNSRLESQDSVRAARSYVKRTKAEPQKCSNVKRVLIVDDNPVIRKAVAAAFLSDGFAVCGEAENGRDAIDLAKKLIPDLIILDLSMPVMNGLQAAPELRKIAPTIPTILFTMFGNELVFDQAPKIGIDLVLSKTESLDSIVQKAHKLMGD